MPIRNHIEAITTTLTAKPTFAYGTANELNRLADEQHFPCVFLFAIPAIELSPAINGSVDNTFTVYLEFLFQTNFDQYTADNEMYVSKALQMANEFIAKAAQYRAHPTEARFFKIKSGIKAKCTPVYNKYDVNTTGVGLTLVLETMSFDAIH
ncbi:hypothetical protein KHS38_09705 [Mucilaginibacter sp. Bleaf8]|uniref:hypothetical protein n=1 Tax=Mucilaginibacter sp. Bleaf8 TaxID=2834430 RepID=UPI001BCD0B5D|nr:hypothetical protein [Mucilaginibacter sp. Bleaf8]MBS7564678.1 hypothetical protein [Mucilaginibacter sp. Bleaf8]